MADMAVTNLTATPLGLHDVDGSHVVVGALGGIAIVDPDKVSSDVLSVYTKSGAATASEAAAPENTVAPVATGTLDIGDTVSVTAGTWTGNPTPALTYQWEVSDGEGWAEIEGATDATLELIADFVDEDVRCIVTGTSAAGTDSATSNPLGPVTDPEA